MALPTIPAFGETGYIDEQQTVLSRVVLIKNAPAHRFADYGTLLEQNGYEKYEETATGYTATQPTARAMKAYLSITLPAPGNCRS